MLRQTKRQKEKFKPFTGRLPEKLWERIAEIADRNKRSTTAQIEWILEKYLKEVEENDGQ